MPTRLSILEHPEDSRAKNFKKFVLECVADLFFRVVVSVGSNYKNFEASSRLIWLF